MEPLCICHVPEVDQGMMYRFVVCKQPFVYVAYCTNPLRSGCTGFEAKGWGNTLQ